MDRRAFLYRFGATLGVALGASCVGSASLAAARRPDGELDVEAYVAAMDEQVARIHGLPDRPEVEALLEANDLPPGFLKRTMASLFVVAAFRDVPRASQEHPALQDRIWSEAPWLGEAQLRMARVLRKLSKADRKTLRTAMREDREALESVKKGLLEGALGSAVEPGRAQQLVDLYEQITFRMRTQDPGILLDEVLDKVARRAARVGATEDTWDELLDGIEDLDAHALRSAVQRLEEARVAAGGAQHPALGDTEVDLGLEQRTAALAALREGPDGSWPTVPEPEGHAGWVEAWGDSPKAAKLARTGAILLGLGLAMTPTGMILSVFAYWLFFPPALATVGAVLSIMGMVYMIVAAAEAKKGPGRPRRDEWDR